jgi:hypothetical protein
VRRNSFCAPGPSETRVLAWSRLIRAVATAMAAAVLAAGAPNVWIYALAMIATAAFTVFRPGHPAVLPRSIRHPSS